MLEVAPSWILLIFSSTRSIPSLPIDPSSLPLVAKIAGFATSWATSIYFLWVKNPPPVISNDLFFRQVRAISIVIISIFLALSWGYLANKDGLGTLANIAILATLAGIMIFFIATHIVRKAARQAQDSYPRGHTGLLVAFLLYTSLISCGVTSVGVFLTVILTNQANAATGAALVRPTEYDVRIAVKGQAQLTENQESPFSATSGQVNFNCGDSPTVEARLRLPAGVNLVGQPTASWQNFDNAKNQDQPIVRLEGDTVIARGVIRGLDYQNFGFVRNCPGGGHGELVLTGAFKTTHSYSKLKEISIPSSISSVIQQPVWVTLPPSTELSISEVSVEFRSRITGKIDGSLSVTNQSTQAFSGPFKVIFDEKKRQIGLVAGA